MNICRRIGIEIQCLAKSGSPETEIGRFTRAHIVHLLKLQTAWKFVLFIEGASRAGYTDLLQFPNVTLDSVINVRQHRLELFHITDPFTILPHRISPFALVPPCIPTSITISDLTPLAASGVHFDALSDSGKAEYLQRLKLVHDSGYFFLCASDTALRNLRDLGKIAADRYAAIDAASALQQGGAAAWERAAALSLEAWGRWISVKKPGTLATTLDPASILI